MANSNVGFLPVVLGAFIAQRSAPLAFLGAVATDPTLPIVSNITPAEGTPINPQDGIGFDVTDAGGNLQRTTVLAHYQLDSEGQALPTFEVVYFGTNVGTFTAGFGPQYTGTRTAITNGFRFSNVVRRGGWPAAPTIVADAGDSSGNESA